MTTRIERNGKQLWDVSFREQIEKGAFNTAPVESLVRTVAHFFRDRFPTQKDRSRLHFLEVGCGAGPNLIWLAEKGVRVSGIDISSVALRLARGNLKRSGFKNRVGKIVEASAVNVPFPDASFDGIIEALVFQHLAKAERQAAFAEVGRLLKPGGVFVGCMLDQGHTVYKLRRGKEDPRDLGTLWLNESTTNIHLTDLGLCHFYSRQEIVDLLKGFSIVDPCLMTYDLPQIEAKKRGYKKYHQSMWTVFAVK